MSRSLAIAFAAGMVATVNPCGFALLPAYLSTFLGLDDSGGRRNPVVRALKVSAVMTLGFITVFGVMGLIINSLVSGISESLYYVTIAAGIIIAALGVYLLTGHEITLSTPKLERGGADGTLVGMYLFGVSYAVASLGCTIGTFLVVTSGAFTNVGFFAGVAGFILYGVGMGLIVSILTVAVALAKDGIVHRFRQLLPYVNRIAGLLMVVAGAYVAYYGWYSIRLLVRGDADLDDPIIQAGLDIQSWLANLFPTADNVWAWGVGLIVVLIVIVLLAKRRSHRSPTEPEPSASMSGS